MIEPKSARMRTFEGDAGIAFQMAMGQVMHIVKPMMSTVEQDEQVTL
jgi:hypothetical protein